MRVFTRAEARAFDRHAMEVVGIPGIVLMENAAIGSVAALARFSGRSLEGRRVEIVCGGGNNGGDGYAMARLLRLAGARPRLRPIGPPRAGSDAEVNARIASALGIDRLDSDAPFEGDLLVDAYLGTGLEGEVSAEARSVIERMNAFAGERFAVDIPSGLDADTGGPLGAAVRASWTATMAAIKRGFLEPGAKAWTGQVEVVSIGCPLEGFGESG